MRIFPVAVLWSLVILVVACGDGEAEGLPKDQIADLRQTAAELSDQAGFRVVAPAYVPSDLRYPPTQAEVAKDQNGMSTGDVTLCFFSRFELRGEVSPLLEGLCIIEQESGLGASSCPPRAEFGHSEIRLSHDVMGTELVIEESGRIDHDLRFCAGQTFVILQLFWNAPEGETITFNDDMRTAALKVAESIIQQVDDS